MHAPSEVRVINETRREEMALDESTLSPLRADPDRLLTEQQVAVVRKCSLATLQRDRRERQGIPYLKLHKAVRYRAGDVLAWVEARRIDTAQAPAA